MTREPIYSALFALLQTVPGVNFYSRRLRHWSECDETIQPALFMTQGMETASTQLKGSPYKWEFQVKVWVYVRVPDDAAPAPVINPIIDSITNLLTPVSGITQTLGGLCNELIIDGSIDTFEGTLGNQEVAVVPIKILVR